MKQHEMALMKANAIRLDQARIRRETRALGGVGLLKLSTMLASPSDSVSRMTLRYFLRCAHRMGDSRATHLLNCADVAPHRLRTRVGMLTDRERRCLSQELVRLAEKRGDRVKVAA